MNAAPQVAEEQQATPFTALRFEIEPVMVSKDGVRFLTKQAIRQTPVDGGQYSAATARTFAGFAINRLSEWTADRAVKAAAMTAEQVAACWPHWERLP